MLHVNELVFFLCIIKYKQTELQVVTFSNDVYQGFESAAGLTLATLAILIVISLRNPYYLTFDYFHVNGFYYFLYFSSIGSLGRNHDFASVEDIYVRSVIFYKSENGARIKTWQVWIIKQENIVARRDGLG